MPKEKKQYKILVSTVYTVNAVSEADAIASIRKTVKDGIFKDNVYITSQMACVADPEDPMGSMFSPNNLMKSVSYFRIGNEQLG